MAWVTPKTNWANGDYFNLNPDYARIKGNIEYLRNYMVSSFRAPVHIETMPTYTTAQYPNAAFLNRITSNIRALYELVATREAPEEMGIWVGNAPGWTAQELNDIETNCLRLKGELETQLALVPKLSYKLGIGGMNFGT